MVAVAALMASAAVALTSDEPGAAPTVRQCTGAEAIDFACFEQRYPEIVRATGAGDALQELARERERNGYVRAACHQLTHRIGRAAGELGGIGAFAEGDPMCSSGYYHGVVEAVMSAIGAEDVIAELPGVCADLRRADRYSADHYNCAHGMGHGFMGIYASDVFRSLEGCDELADGWERRNCYGGVFMENLSAIDNPTRPSTYLKPEHPLYPCTAVPRRYKRPCYDKQSTYALFVTDSDFAEVFDLCSRTERAFRDACYEGLGGDVAVQATKLILEPGAKAETRRRLCMLGEDGRARAACVAGAVTVILRDLIEPAAQARDFCRSFATAHLEHLHRACLRARADGFRELPLQAGLGSDAG